MIALGKPVAEKIKEELKQKFIRQDKKVCFIVFGEDPVTAQFVNMKIRFAEEVGVDAFISRHNASCTLDEIKRIVQEQIFKSYDGIVIQLPLPQGVDTQAVLNLVPLDMDIDVLSDNGKKMFDLGQSKKIPPVARATNEILKYYGVSLGEKKVLVIGSGKLVGEPISLMFHNIGIKFDQVVKETNQEEKSELIKCADIIISGAGDPHFIKPEMIKEGVVIIDAGTSESHGKIVGDVDPRCIDKASLLTPVPGGIGPVTLASLFLNL